MKVSVKKNVDYKISEWSGGTTTQLYIYPENGDYGQRSFQVRISSATVDSEESEFTSLPGVKRYLMTLDGSMRLVHKDHYERELHPGDVEKFSGDWDTSSYGKVKDFNLMLKDAQGMMEYAIIQPGYLWVLPLCCKEWNKVLLYSIEGEINISGHSLSKGELAIVEDFEAEQCVLENQTGEVVKLAICRILINE